MPDQDANMIWVIVSVHSGVPDFVEAYRDERVAELRARTLRKGINEDYDEVGVFEVEIGARSDESN